MTGLVIHDSKGRAYTEDEIAAIQEELERRATAAIDLGDIQARKMDLSLITARWSPERAEQVRAAITELLDEDRIQDALTEAEGDVGGAASYVAKGIAERLGSY